MPASRTRPTMRAPIKAPSRLPRPPMTTTTKARISASTPMPSTAPCWGTMTAPARPAVEQPRAKGRAGAGPGRDAAEGEGAHVAAVDFDPECGGHPHVLRGRPQHHPELGAVHEGPEP